MENEPQDAYLPLSDSEELQPFDVREQSGRRNMLKFWGVIAFLLVLAFVVVKLFSSGTRDRNQTPRIAADNTPYKEVPLERGGTEIPNQDKEIYEVSNEGGKLSAVKTIPVAEEPLPKPVSKPVANVVIKQPETSAIKPVTPKPIVKPAAEPTKIKPTLAFGDYMVQVASLRSQAEAEQTWLKLSKSMSDVLTTSQFADIKRVDLGARGIYYRLRVSGLADRNAANRLCSQLKSRKQDCIVTKK